jgi:hypothetical protein
VNQLWSIGLDPKANTERSGPPQFANLVGFRIPRRFVSADGIDVDAFLVHINENIEGRGGLVLEDGQILTQEINRAEPLDVYVEPESLDHDFETPARREWQAAQRDYFGIENPYQLIEEGDTFTWSSLTTRVVSPYLRSGELIAAVLHGGQDGSYFACTCHYSTVVYTTRHRLLCMSCGATHVVLKEPLSLAPRQLLTGGEWSDFFDANGRRHHEELDLATVDFREVENAPTIWTTNQWEEASRDFVLFARASPEEIAEAIRGTEVDPSILIESGWVQVREPPPPASDPLAILWSLEVDVCLEFQAAFPRRACST